MARVTVEDCVDKVPNRFELVMLATMTKILSLPCVKLPMKHNPLLTFASV